MRRRLIAALAVAGVLIPVAGCASDFQAGLTSIDACRAARVLSTTPVEQTEAVEDAALALAAELPGPLGAHARLLAGPAGDGTPGTARARLRALAELQSWASATCGSALSVGAPRDALAAADELELADFETVVSRDPDVVTVSVLGVNDPLAALRLCEQALAAESDGVGVVQVQVLDVRGVPLAVTDGGACLSAAD